MFYENSQLSLSQNAIQQNVFDYAFLPVPKTPGWSFAGKKKTSQKDGAGAQTLTLVCCSPGNIGTISLREQNEHFSSTQGFKAEIKAFTGGIYCTM